MTKNDISIFSRILSITILRRYFAEHVIVLVSWFRQSFWYSSYSVPWLVCSSNFSNKFKLIFTFIRTTVFLTFLNICINFCLKFFLSINSVQIVRHYRTVTNQMKSSTKWVFAEVPESASEVSFRCIYTDCFMQDMSAANLELQMHNVLMF